MRSEMIHFDSMNIFILLDYKFITSKIEENIKKCVFLQRNAGRYRAKEIYLRSYKSAQLNKHDTHQN